MSATLISNNTTIKYSGSITSRYSGINGGVDQTIVGSIASGEYVIVSSINIHSLGTNTSYLLKVTPSGGSEFDICPSGSTTIGTNMLNTPLYLGTGDILEIIFSPFGANGVVGVTGVKFVNTP